MIHCRKNHPADAYYRVVESKHKTAYAGSYIGCKKKADMMNAYYKQHGIVTHYDVVISSKEIDDIIL